MQVPDLVPGEDGPDPGIRAVDTLNRLLLHGARYHRRDSLFHVAADPSEERDDTVGHPDWRVDRLSIRIGLALREQFGIHAGDAVVVDGPFDWEWLLIERGVTGLGAHTVSVPSGLGEGERLDWIESSGASTVYASPDETSRDRLWSSTPITRRPDGGARFSLVELLDYGGNLDTPERATGWRKSAREVTADSLCTVDWTSGEATYWTQGTMAEQMLALLRRHPPVEGGRHVVVSSHASLAARLVAYSAWADGRTSVLFLASNVAGDDARLGAPRRVFFDSAFAGPRLEGSEYLGLDDVLRKSDR